MYVDDKPSPPAAGSLPPPPAAVEALSAAVDAVVDTDLTRMWPDQLQSVIAAVGPQVERLTGLVSTAVGQLHASAPTVPTADGGQRSVAGWLAETARESGGTAGSRIRTSTALRELPLVAAAVLDGRLTQPQAAVLARLVGKIETAELQSTQAALIQVAATLNPSDLGIWVRHLIATHCEPQLEDDQAAARANRYLQTSREADGSLRGRFLLPSEDSESVLSVLEPLARPTGLTDTRSAGQRRADALVEACDFVLRHGDLPDCGGQRPQLSYVLPADWAARQNDAQQCPHCGPRCPTHRPASFADTVIAGLPGQPGVPAEYACATAAWSGPQTRARIEAILCEARITRVLLDSLGQVTGLEALTDTVTAAQRRALAARDGGCIARGCSRPSAFCDAHHLTSRADGGPTCLDNLALLCRRHHVLWHLGVLSLHDLHVPWHPDAKATGPPPE